MNSLANSRKQRNQEFNAAINVLRQLTRELEVQ